MRAQYRVESMEKDIDILRRYVARVSDVVGSDNLDSFHLQIIKLEEFESLLKFQKKKIQYMKLNLFYVQLICFTHDTMFADIK